MEKVSLSISLIRNTLQQSPRWLARLNEKTAQLDFVIAHRLGLESFREAAIREIAWELRLDRNRDFLVSNMAQINLEFVDQIPGGFDKQHVLTSFYNVEIYRTDAMNSVDIDSRNFWIRSDEICNGVTDCGRRLNPIVPYLINRANVIRHWESSQPIDRSQD